jgi:hypothetical protein
MTSRGATQDERPDLQEKALEKAEIARFEEAFDTQAAASNG